MITTFKGNTFLKNYLLKISKDVILLMKHRELMLKKHKEKWNIFFYL